MPTTGDTVDGYRIEACTGPGVYRVCHETHRTVHALHVLEGSAPIDRPRLLAEARLQARLQHPNWVGISEVLLLDGVPAQVREPVDAPSLARWLADHRDLPDPLGWFRGVVVAIGVAHGVGLVHRGLDPANVLVIRERSGVLVAQVTDFGLGPGDGSAATDLQGLGRVLAALLGDRPPQHHAEVIADLVEPRIRSCADLWVRLWPDPVPPALRVPVVDGSALEAPTPFATLPRHSRPPSGGLDAPPTLVPEDDIPQGYTEARFVPVPRPLWMWPAALGAALALSAVPFGLAVLLGVGGPKPSPPSLVPVAAEFVRVQAPPEPVVAEVVVAPPPVQTPPRKPAVPRPVAAPQPPPPPPPPPPTTGTVSVEGDARAVWLESGGKRIVASGSVAPGTYVVRAAFGNGFRRKAGEVVVRAGVETRIRCASFVYACTEVPR